MAKSMIGSNTKKTEWQSDGQEVDTSSYFRTQFDYVLRNMKRTNESKPLELIDLDLDSDFTSEPMSGSTDIFDLDQTLSEDTNDLFDGMTETEVKAKGEEDVNRALSPQELHSMLESIGSVTSLKSLNEGQLCALVKTFADSLRQMGCHPNSDSYFEILYGESGYPGIAATIQMSLFSKKQMFYILGCLYGLFRKRHDFGHKIFGVLFPETLVRIVMRFRTISYEEALDAIKHNNPSID